MFRWLSMLILLSFMPITMLNAVPCSPGSHLKQSLILPDDYKKYTLSFGDPNAPLKIDIFFSFSCPACLMFHQNHYPVIEKELIDLGKVYWTFIPYVVDVVDSDALHIMSAIALCSPQDKLRIFNATLHDVLNWKENQNKDKIVQLLKNCGLHDTLIDQALSKEHYEHIVQEVFAFQDNIVIDGTPTLFINGQEIPDVPTAAVLINISNRMLTDVRNEHNASK